MSAFAELFILGDNCFVQLMKDLHQHNGIYNLPIKVKVTCMWARHIHSHNTFRIPFDDVNSQNRIPIRILIRNY